MVRIRGRIKDNVTVYLHFVVRVEHTTDADGDPALALTDILRGRPTIVSKGKRNGRVHQEVQKNRVARIAQTVQVNAKTDERTMLYIVKNALPHLSAKDKGPSGWGSITHACVRAFGDEKAEVSGIF